jgi:hypothetical protein
MFFHKFRTFNFFLLWYYKKEKREGLFTTPNVDGMICIFIICGCCVKGVIDVVSWVLLAMQFILQYLKKNWGMHYGTWIHVGSIAKD